MRRLKTEREVIDFVDGLTPDEAKAILQTFNGSPEVMRLLRAEGVVVEIVRKRRARRAAPPRRPGGKRRKDPGSNGDALTMGEFLALDVGEERW